MPTELPKSLNVFWTVSAALSLWLLIIHAPPVLVRRDAIRNPAFVWHMIGIYSVSLGCIINALVTPSVWGGRGKAWHIWSGRWAMIGGVVGASSGAWLAWHELQYLPLGFVIWISAIGVVQLYAQVKGYNAIREFRTIKEQLALAEVAGESEVVLNKLRDEQRRLLNIHIHYMILLFVVACGFPAGLRLGEVIGQARAGLSVIVIYLGQFFWFFPYSRRMKVPPPSQQLSGEGSSTDKLVALEPDETTRLHEDQSL